MSKIIGRGRYATETYPEASSTGGGSAAIVPLSRQRFIDGDTAQPGLTGSAAEPFKTIAEFMASRPNASSADATANYVGWVMPALNGYPESVAFPPFASTELRADSLSLAGADGTNVVGNVTWANAGGAHAATAAVAALHNVSVSGNITLTDAAAPPSAFVYSGDEIPGTPTLTGNFDSTGTSALASVAFVNVGVIGNINAGVSASSAVAGIFGCSCVGDIHAKSLAVRDSTLTASVIATEAGTGSATFLSTSFSGGGPVTLTAPGGATFDGPSWKSFVEGGGVRAAGTFVLAVGGYNGGSVEGAALTGAATNVSLNGTGATAGYTAEHSGNHYSSASSTPTSVTLKTGGGELVGDTILISRTTLGTGLLAVINGGVGAGTIGTIPVNARGFVLAQFDGTNWVFASGGSMLA